MSIPKFEEIIEPNDQTAARREHLDALRELVGNVYANKFDRTRLTGREDTITSIVAWTPVVDATREMSDLKATLAEGERPPAEFKDALNERLKALGTIRIAGRLTTPPRGNFVHLTDGKNKLQIYAKNGQFSVVKNTAAALSDSPDSLDPQHSWTVWKLIDHGDFVGVEGFLFVTNTGEVSVHVEKLQFLSKAMLPMPDKIHGIADAEIRQRQRYYDLIGSALQVEHEGLPTREVFERRARLISSLRHFLEDHGYIEVETPMLTPKATGAAAKPFETHHNALDITLYARIAPELYLKRLVVGGFEKVYELNRNFRNEGISYKHNPEFTMLEFYCAYMDVNGMMDFCEHMLQEAIRTATGSLKVEVSQVRGGVPLVMSGHSGSRSQPGKPIEPYYLNIYENEVDFSVFRRVSMEESVVEVARSAHRFVDGDFLEWLNQGANTHALHKFLHWMEEDFWDEIAVYDQKMEVVDQLPDEKIHDIVRSKWEQVNSEFSREKLNDRERAQAILDLFEDYVEERLIQPTFITDYPKIISPLSKADPARPQVAERFELFINGMEVANGFSELNDPREQYERFVDQMAERERGDEEAMVLDEDYIRALSYGMPPAAGIGVGIDRLTMLLTNKHSIRDVILFPHMRPEKRSATEDTENTETE
jgi:lysyl-tRNA synthetase class 2